MFFSTLHTIYYNDFNVHWITYQAIQTVAGSKCVYELYVNDIRYISFYYKKILDILYNCNCDNLILWLKLKHCLVSSSLCYYDPGTFYHSYRTWKVHNSQPINYHLQLKTTGEGTWLSQIKFFNDVHSLSLPFQRELFNERQ